jgi:hypothetical protein
MAAHFAKLTTTRSYQISTESLGMEETQRNYSQQDERRVINVHLDIEGTNSNAHGEERDENLNMVETIKNLQKDGQIHKAGNEKLMIAKE